MISKDLIDRNINRFPYILFFINEERTYLTSTNEITTEKEAVIIHRENSQVIIPYSKIETLIFRHNKHGATL